MLRNDLFHFTPPHIEGNVVRTTLELNAAHPIFAGHFPDQPILPGVCMMQIVKEILEEVIGAPTRLMKASEMKFLAVINPNENPSVELELVYTAIEDTIKVDATIYNATVKFFKFKGVFVTRL